MNCRGLQFSTFTDWYLGFTTLTLSQNNVFCILQVSFLMMLPRLNVNNVFLQNKPAEQRTELTAHRNPICVTQSNPVCLFRKFSLQGPHLHHTIAFDLFKMFSSIAQHLPAQSRLPLDRYEQPFHRKTDMHLQNCSFGEFLIWLEKGDAAINSFVERNFSTP